MRSAAARATGMMVRRMGGTTTGTTSQIRLVLSSRVAAMSSSSKPSKMYDILASTESSQPFHETLRVSPHTLSARQLREEADALATGLKELGAEPGVRMLVCVEGGGTHSVVQLAASKLGLTVAFVDPRADKEAFAASIRTVGPGIIVFAAGANNARANMIQQLFPDTLSAGWNRTIDPSEEFPTVETIICTSTDVVSGCVRIEDCLVYGNNGVFHTTKSEACTGPFLLQLSADGKQATEVSESSALEWAASAAKQLKLQNGDRVLTVPPLVGSSVFVASTLAPLVANVLSIIPRSADKAAILEALDGPKPSVIVATNEGLAALDAAVAGNTHLIEGVRRVDVSSLHISA